jgi:isopentenyldiphosphate isomerase
MPDLFPEMSSIPSQAQPELLLAWQQIRREVGAAGSILNQGIFERLQQVFLGLYASGQDTPASLTRGEYYKDEFLLALDERGQAVQFSPELLEQYRQTAALYPCFARWFQEQALPAGGRVLLAARWLCHQAGLLHGTVEIFIDPPHLPGHTLVQVRGMGKVEAPGAFDIPCAGHISGVDGAEEALRKELAEELDLFIDNLSDLHQITRYNSIRSSNFDWAVNNEHRVLYRAKLKNDAAARIRFADGEVAGLGVMNVAELRLLVERYPERIAAGLSDAMKYYV